MTENDTSSDVGYSALGALQANNALRCTLLHGRTAAGEAGKAEGEDISAGWLGGWK
jgi:hypothetical protein